jgi:predicted nucleotidyltransferase
VKAQRSDDLLALLHHAGFEFVIVGGVAAIAHGATRSTKDLDVVAPFTTENLRRLLDALKPHDVRHLTRPDLGVVSQTAEELSGYRLLLLESDLGRLDVLREVPPIGHHGDLKVVEMELVQGLRFRVIALDQLIEIKASLGRPQDKDVERDLRAIRALRDARGDAPG